MYSDDEALRAQKIVQRIAHKELAGAATLPTWPLLHLQATPPPAQIELST